MATRTTKPRAPKRAAAGTGAAGGTAVATPAGENGGGNARDTQALEEVLAALTAARDGDFSSRLRTRRRDLIGELQVRTNELLEVNARMARELSRVSRVIGREGRMMERASLGPVPGAGAEKVEAVNSLIDDLVRPTTEVARVIEAVADGGLSEKMAMTIEGQPVKGEFARIGTTVHTMVDQLSSFADEVTRVAREVGTDGKLGGRRRARGAPARGRTSPTRWTSWPATRRPRPARSPTWPPRSRTAT